MAFVPSFLQHGGAPDSPLEFHSSCYRYQILRQQKYHLSEGTVNAARCVGHINVHPAVLQVKRSHRKLVLRVMLGEDLAALRVAALALLALAFKLSWFPLTAASRRDFR